MDLSNLLKEKKYHDILEISKNHFDAETLSYRLNALIALGRNEEALLLINKYNQTLYEKNPLATMKLHFELLLQLNKYVEAINLHHEYSERPYISQQVEEFLHSIPNEIIKNQKRNEAKNLFLDENKVNELFLKSKDASLLTNAIYHLKQLEIVPYLSSLSTLLKRKDVSDDVKTLALLILVMKKVNRMFIIYKQNKELSVNPSKLKAPYSEIEYKEIMEYILKYSKDPTIESVASNLFNQYVLNSFPGLIYNDTSKKMAVAFIALSKRYLKEESAVNATILENNENVKEITSLMDNYQKKIDNL